MRKTELGYTLGINGDNTFKIEICELKDCNCALNEFFSKLEGKDFACNTCMIILLTCYQRVYDTTKI